MSLTNINSTLKNVTNNLSQVISVTNALGTTLGTTITNIRSSITTLSTKVASMGMVYLGSVSVSGGALSDTTIVAANATTYRSFQFVSVNLIGTVAGQTYLLQWHSGGGFQSSSYSASIMYTNGATTFASAASTTGIVVGFTDTGTVPGSSGLAIVSGLGGTTLGKLTRTEASSSDSGAFYRISGSGVWNSTSPINGFQVVASDASSLSSGRVDVYGIL